MISGLNTQLFQRVQVHSESYRGLIKQTYEIVITIYLTSLQIKVLCSLYHTDLSNIESSVRTLL